MEMMRALKTNRYHQVLNANRSSYGTIGRRSQSGFSLVEIMVVLVVLLIGILAVVRIYPGGFLSIAHTAEMTAADALNRQQLDALKRAANQPEAIYATDASGNVVNTILPTDLSDLSVGNPILSGGDPWYYSNVNRFRNIMGETFRVPAPTSNTTVNGNVAIYPLQYGPVENVLTATSDKILVYGVGLQRTAQSSLITTGNPTGTAVLRSESEYAIDYDHLLIAFQPRLIDPSRGSNNFRQFTVSYDYYYLNGVTGAVNVQFQPNAYDPSTATVTTVITVPDVSPTPAGGLPAPVWQPIFTGLYTPDPVAAAGYTGMTIPTTPALYLGPSGAFPPAANSSFAFGIVHDSEEVSRKFRLALPGTSVEAGGVPVWSNGDPYEYAWYSRQNAGNTANVGILIFNPGAHNQSQTVGGVAQPLTARVDYKIYDNHILRDDRTVPTAAPYIVSLSVPFLKLNGDILDNLNPLNNFSTALNPYNGISRDPANTTPDVIIYNIATGVNVGTWTNVASNPGTGVLTQDNTDVVPVDQRTGVLTLNAGMVASMNLQGASLRILYQAQHDWGMQVLKASAHYREATTPTNVDFRHYYIGDGTTGGVSRIYFAPCDAGKTVEIGEFYAVGNSQPFRNQSYQITSDSAQFDSSVSPALPYIDVSSTTGGAGFSAAQTGRRVSNVQGLSVKSRVIWEDTKRWRHSDNDSVLIQAPSQ